MWEVYFRNPSSNVKAATLCLYTEWTFKMREWGVLMTGKGQRGAGVPT